MTDGCHVAFDLGAESGRAVVGRLSDDGRLRLEEVRRFANRPVRMAAGLYWDLPRLYAEVVDSLAAIAARHDMAPSSVGIATWGVDFALFDRRGEMLGLPRAYRDPRHAVGMARALQRLTRERLYEITGIQLLPFNTLFQLAALAVEESPALAGASTLLFLPDALGYFLSGVRCTERTIASTSQLLDVTTGGWSEEILAAIGVSPSVMPAVATPGSELGPLADAVASETGLRRTRVVSVASHDTASAVAAVPASDRDFAFVSSGTWSLVGFESRVPVVTAQSRAANVTNEAGYDGTYRVLKNVAGLWLLQECRRAWSSEHYTYDDLAALAASAPPRRALVDPDDPSFRAPADMPAAIAAYCRSTGQDAPQSHAEVARCVLESLALAYRRVIAELSAIAPRPITRIHVVGGGSRNHVLCQLAADACRLPVVAGPAEATAIGNLLVQNATLGGVRSLAGIRGVVRESFPVRAFEPVDPEPWDEAHERFLRLSAPRAARAPASPSPDDGGDRAVAGREGSVRGTT